MKQIEPQEDKYCKITKTQLGTKEWLREPVCLCSTCKEYHKEISGIEWMR